MTHQQGENQSGQGQAPQQPQGQEAAHAAAQQQAAQAHYAQQHQQGYSPGGHQHQQYQQQYAPQGSAPSAAQIPGAGQVPPHGPPTAGSGGNFLADTFDPTFAKKATVTHARWYYLLVVIVVLLGWLGKTVLDFVEGAADHAGYLMGGGGYEGPFAEAAYNPWPGLYTLFVGGAIAFSLIILARMFLENTIANSKISARAAEKDG